MRLDFTDKVVLVTGGTSGIGLASVKLFLQDGAQVMMSGTNSEKADAIISRLGYDVDDGRGRLRFHQADVAKVDECRRLIERTVSCFGRIDSVVNSAGVFKFDPIDNVSEADYDWIMDVNVKGTFFVCKYAVPELRKTCGNIVNISSDAGIQGNALSSAYCASKGAVTIFTKALAVDVAPDNVRVNCVCPGDIVTPMLDKDLARADNPGQYLKNLTDPYPVGRLGNVDEVASVIAFLASDASLFTTGAAWSVDGGITAS
ncbi:SDR family NAD(P)-dependent oxidoreductase [Desulforhopalus singaporensis]|uniref:NAD(P)-dependent dehydrogenase, short-chain alcohol dehydrogenase family n=1 Tax=Desulforhopalus singaporensis TaxID=91360 RepID=A0A1H0NVN7_9BACT|nr:SDR family NAD(P)-dependent oxidoreductase [Desulforhopalus singaporensis]SDO96724.1 NAD(P)-dependent dehydrogenase, short-chain alcohol dehydrogenase family [Desulforhopalus singaporensis]